MLKKKAIKILAWHFIGSYGKHIMVHNGFIGLILVGDYSTYDFSVYSIIFSINATAINIHTANTTQVCLPRTLLGLTKMQ